VRAADSCINLPSGSQYGENMLWSHAAPRAGPAGVDAWYLDNPGPQSGYYCSPFISDTWASFNLIVWRATTQLGCGVVTCPDTQDELFICHYNVPGNTGTDKDAQANIGPWVRLPTECATIADGHDAGMFVSSSTDTTNPAALAIGCLIGAVSFIVFAVLLWFKREAWFAWASAKLANQQPFIMALAVIAMQIICFAFYVRSGLSNVPWVTLSDGSWLNGNTVCMARTAQVGGTKTCAPFALSQICQHQYQCNGIGAPQTAEILIIIAAVAAWIVLAAETGLAVPRIPLEPRLGATIAIGGVMFQIGLIWISLWMWGGYVISYFSGRGFPYAGEGTFELIVCVILFIPLLIISTAQMTLHTK